MQEDKPQQKESNHKVTAVGGFGLDPKKNREVGKDVQFFGAAIPQMIHGYKQLLYGCFRK